MPLDITTITYDLVAWVMLGASAAMVLLLAIWGVQVIIRAFKDTGFVHHVYDADDGTRYEWDDII